MTHLRSISRSTLALLALALTGRGFAQSATPPVTTPTTPAPATPAPLPDAPSTTAHAEPAAVPTGPVVLLDTSMGRLTCQLYDKEAPETTANFVGLAGGTKAWTDPNTQQKITGKPFYDGTQFHRVIPGFMIQGGDRLATGTGDAGYYIADEISPALRFDVPGRLAMANSGPNTNSAQFFITEAANPSLNGHYTIFGQCDPHTVVMVGSIARVERDGQDKPLTPVVLNKVLITPPGQSVPAAPGNLTNPTSPSTPKP